MNYENCLKDMFESIPDYIKIIFLLFLIENDVDTLEECGFLKSNVQNLGLEEKNFIGTE